jgi:DNA-binding transcriptional ArsR family regulator
VRGAQCILRLMHEVARELPIFRSTGQARLLALLMTAPDDTWRSVTDAARLMEMAPSSVGREVDRLAVAGLVEEQRVGNVRQIRADRSSPYFPELHALVLKAAGPVPVLREALAGMPDLAGAWVFGSWARRILGEPGAAPPRDVDVLLVGDPDPAEVYAATARAEQQLGQDVDPVIVTSQEWEDATRGRASAFLRAVREGSRVDVFGAP